MGGLVRGSIYEEENMNNIKREENMKRTTSSDGGSGGDGGSFLACEDFGRMFDHSFPACAPPPPSPSEDKLGHTNPLFMP